jgi:hypothetical protein
MSKIIQIIPCDPYVRIARYDSKNSDSWYLTLNRPVCVALTERGRGQDINFMELKDDGIVEVDTEDNDFLGFVSITNKSEIRRLKKLTTDRKGNE